MPVCAADLTTLPYASGTFDGYVSWYSTIHLADDTLLRQVLREAHRVLRPGGLAMLAFHTGVGERDLAEVYARLGHAVTLNRYRREAAAVSAVALAAGFRQVGRWERATTAGDGRAALLLRR